MLHYYKYLLLFLTLTLTACGGESEGSASNDTTPPATITSIIFSSNSAALHVDDKLQITSTVTYSDQSQNNITTQGDWNSSDPDVVSVSQGELLAISGGNAIITQRYQGKETSLDAVVSIDADVSLTLASSKLTFRWKSVFADELGYQIQKKALTRSSTKWDVITEIGPITEGFYGQQDIEDNTATYRLVALVNNGVEVLSSSQGTSYFDYDRTEAMAMSIVPPVTPPPYLENVIFSLSQDVLSSQWFVDSNNSCGSSTCNSNSINLNTGKYSDGNHRLDVRAEIEPDVFVYLNQTIDIYNPNLTLSLRVQDKEINTSYILVNASSKAEVSEINYYIDNQLVTTQVEATPITFNGVTYPYYFIWSKEYGEHEIKVTAEDTDGEYQEQEKDILTNLAPTVIVSSPLNNQLITGDLLTVTGEVNNENQNVTTTVSFGDIQIGQKQGTGSFSYSYSLAGLPENNYQVSVTSIDEFDVKANEQALFKYAPRIIGIEEVYTIPDSDQVVEINNTQLLSKNNSFNYLIKDLSLPNTEPRMVNFEYEPTTTMYNPHVNQNGDFSSDYNSEMYLNKGQGNQNLSELVSDISNNIYKSNFSNFHQKKLVTDSYSPHSFYIWDSETLTYESLVSPVNTTTWASRGFTNNDEWICLIALTGKNGVGTIYDIYIYPFGSGGVPIRLTYNNFTVSSWCLGNDSDYAFYSIANPDPEQSSLYLYSIAENQHRLISSSVVGGSSFNNSTKSIYADGVLAWQESNNGIDNLKIMPMDTGISYSIPNATLQKVRFGKVSYTTPDGLFVWLQSSLESRAIWPSSITHYLSQESNYIVSGSLIYRVDD